MERLPKKIMQAQREAYDAACDALGLPHGRVQPGKGHWKYVTQWEGHALTVIIVCSPRNHEHAVRFAKTNLRGAIAHILKTNGVMG